MSKYKLDVDLFDSLEPHEHYCYYDNEDDTYCVLGRMYRSMSLPIPDIGLEKALLKAKGSTQVSSILHHDPDYNKVTELNDEGKFEEAKEGLFKLLRESGIVEFV